MRKFHFLTFFFTFLCVYLCFCCFAFAFSENYSVYSLEDLYIINQQVQAAIFEKTGSATLEPGMYEVGVDIPAGNYYFEGVPDRFSTSVSVYPSITKTRTIDQITSVHNVGYTSSCQSVKTGKIILQDGWIVEIVQGPAIIKPFAGVFN